jgi:hypothetical protein
MRKTTSQIALERLAQILGVDVSALWRLARALKEATDGQGADLDLWLTHKRGGDNLAPEVWHLVNLILALVPGQPADAVSAVRSMREWVPAESYSIVTQRRVERVVVKRNALMPEGSVSESWETDRTITTSEVLETGLRPEGSNLAGHLEGVVADLLSRPEDIDAWMQEVVAGRIEVDLGAGTARVITALTEAGDSGQWLHILPFNAPQQHLSDADNSYRVERIVRLPLSLLGVVAKLLVEFRSKRGGALDLPPSEPATPTDPGHENEKASDPGRSEASTRAREGRQSQSLDTGPHYRHPDNMGEKAISQPHKSCAWDAAWGNSAPELGLT